MKRIELEHVLRAAGAITGISEWVVIGSQAILGTHPDAPSELLVSSEVDLYPPSDPSKADLVDGSIGELSPFHEQFGYHAHGVGPETAKLPRNWMSRAARVRNENTGHATGICPHPADLAVSKLLAGRPKDIHFVRVLLQTGWVSADSIRQLAVELEPADAEKVRRLCPLVGDDRPKDPG